MLDFELKKKTDVWSHLRDTDKPVVLYGTGNGADKILHIFGEYGITVSDIFVSNEMYREGSEFCGHTLLRYDDIKAKYGDFIVVLAFAAFRRDLLKRIYDISEEYELVAPCVSVFGNDAFSAPYLKSHEKMINEAYRAFYDDVSRQVFKNLLEYRISGNIQYLRACETEREEVFRDIIRLSDNETYVDLGAYRGDTVEEFLMRTKGRYEKIYAFEPDSKNYEKLIENFGTLENAEFTDRASWSDSRVVRFSGGGGRNSSMLDIDGTPFCGTETIHTTDVDSVLNGREATFIKMDVEGAEAETLAGLSKTIASHRPKLAVSAYHKISDLFTLPVLIKELNPEYKIFLRHHPYIPDWETNLYCI